MSYHNRKTIVSVIYRSSSQSNKEFVSGDFKARSQSWWSNDINTTEGSKLLALSYSNDFCQLINEPTHIQTNSTSSIDLIFIDKWSLLVDSGVNSLLHPNCRILPNYLFYF